MDDVNYGFYIVKNYGSENILLNEIHYQYIIMCH